MSGERNRIISAVLIGPRRFELREVEKPRIREDEVLIRNAYTALCGSELSSFLGISTSFPNYQRLQEYPKFNLGHEGSGVVEGIGSGVKEFKPGDWVVPRKTTYSTYTIAKADTLVKIPEGVTLKQASLALMTQETYYIVLYTQISPKDEVLIVGIGPFGLLLLENIREVGCSKIICCDQVEERLQLARDLGATHVINTTTNKLLSYVRSVNPEGLSVTIDTTGKEGPLKEVFKAVSPFGKVILAGRPYDKLHDFEVEDIFHKMVTVYGAKTPPAGYHPAYTRKALDLIREEKIHADKLITHVYRPEQINEAFEQFAFKKEIGIKVVIEWI